eukprot:3756829-Pyramimonas_sp.AAC.1
MSSRLSFAFALPIVGRAHHSPSAPLDHARSSFIAQPFGGLAPASLGARTLVLGSRNRMAEPS